MSEEYEKEFCVLLKSLREKRQDQRRWGMKWTQDAVAKKLGVSRVSYNNWENGVTLPSRIHLKKIVAYFYLDETEEMKLYRAAGQVPPDKENIAYLPNPLFTGRKSYLKQLFRLFPANGSVMPMQRIVISGLAGMGKTQLALAYAYRRYPNAYRAVLWVNADDRTTLETDFGSLTQTLGLPEKDEQELARRIQAVKQWLKEHTNWLLIMDNADDLQLARSFIPETNHGHILLTTRSQIVGNVGAPIMLERMPQAEGQYFLLRRSLPTVSPTAAADDIRESASELVDLLGGHPLALDQAGAYIHEGVSFTEYKKLYQEKRNDLLRRRGSLDSTKEGTYSEHPDSVVATFELCFAKAYERQPLAIDLLRFCAFLQPDAIPDELFRYDDTFNSDTTGFIDGRTALLRYSLIKRNLQKETLSLHRLVQEVLIDDTSSDVQKQWRERVVHVLDSAFPDVTFENWGQCERLLPHALVCAKWTEVELTMTSKVFQMLTKAAVYLQEQGEYVQAEEIFLRAFNFWVQQLGISHPTTMASGNRLAQLYKKKGEHQVAKKIYRWALKEHDKQLGFGHPAVASALNELGMLYVSERKYKNATLLISLSMKIRRDRLGDSHPATLQSFRDLATGYRYQGEFDTAIKIYKEARSFTEKSLGSNHPDTMHIVRELGMTYALKGEYELAVPLFNQSTEFFLQYLGENHPDYTKCLVYIAWFFYLQGNYEKSDDLYYRLFMSRVRRAKMDRLDYARACYGWALVRQQQGRYEKVEQLYKQAILIYEREAGGTAAYAPDLKRNYAALLRDMQRYTDAEAVESSDDPPYDWDKDEVDRDLLRYWKIMGEIHRQSQSPFDT